MSTEQHLRKDSERFTTLFSRLSNIQWNECAIQEAQTHLATCQSQARLIQEKINVCNAVVDKEHQRFVDMKACGIIHIWYMIQGKLEQNLAKQEKAWLQALEKRKEEEQRLVVLKEEIFSAEQHLYQCQNSYEEHTRANRILGSLSQSFSSGGTLPCLREDPIKFTKPSSPVNARQPLAVT